MKIPACRLATGKEFRVCLKLQFMANLSIPNYRSAEEALSIIKSGDRVFVQGSAATPQFLVRKLVERAP